MHCVALNWAFITAMLYSWLLCHVSVRTIRDGRRNHRSNRYNVLKSWHKRLSTSVWTARRKCFRLENTSKQTSRSLRLRSNVAYSGIFRKRISYIHRRQQPCMAWHLQSCGNRPNLECWRAYRKACHDRSCSCNIRHIPLFVAISANISVFSRKLSYPDCWRFVCEQKSVLRFTLLILHAAVVLSFADKYLFPTVLNDNWSKLRHFVRVV